MKKISKKTLITIIGVTLAVVLTVGGTFTYLFNTTEWLENSFKGATISVSIDETSGQEYTIVPGSTVKKDPKVTYQSPDVDAYVFVTVDDKTNNLVTYEIAEGWRPVEGLTGVYYREVVAGDAEATVSVLKNDQVSYSSHLNTNDLAQVNAATTQLRFKGSIIQKAPFNNPATAYAALQPAVTVSTADDLAAALAAGGNVVLDADVFIDEPLVVTGAATLDMAGHTISNVDDLWNTSTGDWSLISVDGGNLFITGNGSFIAKDNDCYAADIRGDGTLTIENGTFVGNITAVYAYEGNLVINGGSFDIVQLSSYNDYRYLINSLDANWQSGRNTIVVNGGTFHNFDPSSSASENPLANLVPAGHTVTEADGWYTVH